MTRNYTNINLVLLPEQRKALEKWSKDEDRSISAVLRRILEKEIERREAQEKETVSKTEGL